MMRQAGIKTGGSPDVVQCDQLAVGRREGHVVTAIVVVIHGAQRLGWRHVNNHYSSVRLR
jgi:hypothetical protein